MNWVEKIKTLAPYSGELLFDEPLAKHTYFKIGGPASVVAVPKSVDDLISLARFAKAEGVDLFILGLGSNLLVSDSGFPGLVIKTTKLPPTLLEEGGGIRVGAGVSVASLLRKAATEGWDGFEAVSGIPGTIGGLVAMNGGTHLGESSDRVLEVRSFDFSKPGEPIRVRRGGELSFSYRKNSFLSPHEIVIDSLWKLERGDPSTIREKLDTLYRRRKETQPLDFPSCGSVFKNPRDSGLRAWEVVEKLGLRGHRIGNARISEKHPNWILNLGGARANDVIALIELVKSRAKRELGITMVEEVRILP